MTHRSRRQRQKFECGHVAFGTYCHRCKDEKAGRLTPKKKVMVKDDVRNVVAADAPKRYWNRAKCPFCGQSRVKKNEINAFSPSDIKEYRCVSYECGKEFNSEQVKEYERVEVRERLPRDPNPRLTD